MNESKLSAVSDDGTLLAICNSNGTLKLWDTSINILEHEFHPGEYLTSSITCLKFSPKGRKTFKKKKKKSIDTSSEWFIALGTLDGAILIYSPDKQKVVNKFNHSTTSSVTDISWQSSTKFISVGENKKLVVWDINDSKLYSLDTIESKSFCTVGKNEFVIGNTSLQFIKYDHKTKEASSYVLPCHKTSITQLVPIFLGEESSARYVLSSAQNDRYVYAWSTQNREQKEPVGSFLVQDFVTTVCCFDMDGSSVGIAVTTDKGFLRYFLHHFNGSKNLKPLSYQGSLKIKCKTRRKEHLTIMNARFISTTEILIVYGTEVFPRCEKISIEKLVGEVKWNRPDPGVFSKGAKVTLGKTITPAVPDSAVHLMPSQINPVEMKEVSKKRKKGGEANLPMEERLDALSLTQPLPGVPVGRPLDNYVHLLVQALHSKDASLMNNILSKGDDEEIINNTVRRLPATQVVPFLQYLQEIIVGKGLKNLTCINWIKSVLYHHMSLLSTFPDREELLQPFHAIFATRTSCFLAVSKLHARISLLLTHVKNRHENVTRSVTNSHSDALLKYRDDSSDEEDMRIEMEGGGPSESEDIWDDWTEDEDEEEEEEGGEEEGGEKERRKASKRKLPNEEDLIPLGDSEEEEGEEEEESGEESE